MTTFSIDQVQIVGNNPFSINIMYQEVPKSFFKISLKYSGPWKNQWSNKLDSSILNQMTSLVTYSYNSFYDFYSSENLNLENRRLHATFFSWGVIWTHLNQLFTWVVQLFLYSTNQLHSCLLDLIVKIHFKLLFFYGKNVLQYLIWSLDSYKLEWSRHFCIRYIPLV